MEGDRSGKELGKAIQYVSKPSDGLSAWWRCRFAAEAIDEIRDKDVCKGDLYLAKAILAMTAGDLDDAVSKAGKSIPMDSKLQGRDRVAADKLKVYRAILASEE